MASKNKQMLVSKVENKKTLSYQKGNTSLGFTLNTEVKSELKDFLDLLKQAAVDVEKLISERN